MNEEQQEEIKVLQCIYGERFTELEEEPPIIRISDIEGDGYGFNLEVEFTSAYPNELPKFSIVLVSGRLPGDMEELKKHVRAEAEKSIGVVMVFTLVSAIEEWISVARNNKNQQEQKQQSQRLVKELDIGVVRLQGGPVTTLSFNEWLEKFNIEQAKLKQQQQQQSGELKKPAIGGGKSTGKQLFEKNKALATSDVNFDDNDAVVIDDEMLYDGLDDLDISDHFIDSGEENVYVDADS